MRRFCFCLVYINNTENIVALVGRGVFRKYRPSMKESEVDHPYEHWFLWRGKEQWRSLSAEKLRISKGDY